MAERQLVLMTGTSRDVGKFAAYGFAQAGFDVLGCYRNPGHAEEQQAIISQVKKEYKVEMDALEGDLVNPWVQDGLADKVDLMGGKLRAVVLSTAGGYVRGLENKTTEQVADAFEKSRDINVRAQLELLRKMRPFMDEHTVLLYLTSDPAHNAHRLVSDGQDPLKVLGDYAGVAIPKNEAEAQLREEGARVLVGNALEGTFVTRVLKRQHPETVKEWLGRTEHGYFPTAIDMAVGTVNLVRGNYPAGHTAYVGIAEPFQLYRGSELRK